MHATATARWFTSVARCVTGGNSITKPTAIRTFSLSSCVSPSVSTSLSSHSWTSFGRTNTITNGIPHSQQIPNDENEQRRHRSNRSRRGLYDGKDIRTGNNLSFSMKHTKRTFKPNVFVKRVYSEILDEMVRFHLTTSTLRSIDKCGGLDNYLLTSRHVTSGEGLKTKKRIINTLKYRERKARQQQTDNSVATSEA